MAMLIMAAFSASTIACILFIKWLLVRENHKLKEAAEHAWSDDGEGRKAFEELLGSF